MSEWRDFLESVELTERQEEIYDLACGLEHFHLTYESTGKWWTTFDNLKRLLIEEFTGVKIV